MHKDGVPGAKEKLCAALGRLIEKFPLDKMSVTELVQEAAITRQAFYLHYKNKYDFIQDYFAVLAKQCLLDMRAGGTVRESLIRKFDFLGSHSLFIGQVYALTECKASIEQYDYDHSMAFYMELIERSDMTAKLYFQLRLYCHGCASMTTDWVVHGMKKSSAELTDSLIAAMPALPAAALGARL